MSDKKILVNLLSNSVVEIKGNDFIELAFSIISGVSLSEGYQITKRNIHKLYYHSNCRNNDIMKTAILAVPKIGLFWSKVHYQDGSLVIENLKWTWPMRDYACYYRVDDDLFIAHLWLLAPHVESGEQHWYKDSFCFKGLPAPQSGQYTLHTNPNDKPTGLTRQHALHPARTVIYNLQGREVKSISGEKDFLHELQGLPQGQIYLIDGKKVLWK